jgi:hypothetical protein
MISRGCRWYVIGGFWYNFILDREITMITDDYWTENFSILMLLGMEGVFGLVVVIAVLM